LIYENSSKSIRCDERKTVISIPSPIDDSATATDIINKANICPCGYPHSKENIIDVKLKLYNISSKKNITIKKLPCLLKKIPTRLKKNKSKPKPNKFSYGTKASKASKASVKLSSLASPSSFTFLYQMDVGSVNFSSLGSVNFSSLASLIFFSFARLRSLILIQSMVFFNGPRPSSQ
jgi:hypothetical protein